jgi:hypothetical protein
VRGFTFVAQGSVTYVRLQSYFCTSKVDRFVILGISSENNSTRGNYIPMLRIITNPATLTTSQRKALSDFIVNFPESAADDESTIIPSFKVWEEESPEFVFSPVSDQPVTNIITFPVSVPTPVPGIALDSNGLPWDARIHTSSHATNADNSWRRKRGVDEATIAQVEGELKVLMSIPFTPTSPLPSAVAPTPVPVVPPPPPAAVVAAPVPPPPAAPEADPYIGLITRVSDLIVAKVISMGQVDAAVTAVGCASLGLLMSRPDLVPQVRAAIEGWVAAAA